MLQMPVFKIYKSDKKLAFNSKKAFAKVFLQFLSNFCSKIYLRIFVKKQMRSNGMPMFFQVGTPCPKCVLLPKGINFKILISDLKQFQWWLAYSTSILTFNFQMG